MKGVPLPKSSMLLPIKRSMQVLKMDLANVCAQ